MHKSALIIHAMLWAVILLGALMALAPQRVIRARQSALRTFRRGSPDALRQPIGGRTLAMQRGIGAFYAIGGALLVFVMGVRVGRLPPAAPSTPPAAVNAALEHAMAAIVRPALAQHAGLVAAAIVDDAQVVSGFGRIDLRAAQAPDGRTVFEIGSLSKVFTGALLANLIAEGRLRLDTPVAALLDDVAAPADPRFQAVTLQHVLTHTAGFPRMPARTFHPAQIWNMVTAGDAYRAYTTGDVLRAAAGRPLRHAPGAQFAYSNLGFGLLGVIASRQTGLDYAQAVSAMLAEPLGMVDTTMTLTPDQRARLAPGYRLFLPFGSGYYAQPAALWEFPAGMAGAGGLRSTANDLLRFLAANMGRSPSALTPVLQRSHAVLFDDGRAQVGLGWFHAPCSTSSDQRMIWHDGMTGGHASFFGFTTDYRVGVVVLGNSAHSVVTPGRRLLEALSGAEPPAR